MIQLTDIYAKTDAGFDIIQHFYPNATKQKNKKFKIRDEKTPSSCCKEINRLWHVTDFGSEARAKSPIDVAIQELNLEFKEAIKHLAALFHVSGTDNIDTDFRPIFEKRKATKSEKSGDYILKFRKEPTESELKTLGAYVTAEHMKRYSWKSLESYTYIKDSEALTFTATDNFPMFIIEGKGFQKLYKPKDKKEYRFLYIGTKPNNYIFGFEQLEKQYKKNLEASQENFDPDADDTDIAGKATEKAKIDSVILCSGDRDALNVASLGFYVLWLNSETSYISLDDYKKITSMCKEFYNVPDIDSTGLTQGRKFALQFLKCNTVWLPEDLRKHKDFRGNPCKDVTDYLKYYNKRDFDSLKRTALPLMFWKEVPQYDRKGNFKAIKYEFNNTTAYEFLNANGYYRYETKNEKEGFIYVKVEKNIATQILPVEIKTFVNNYLKELGFNMDLRNMIYRSDQLSQNSLSNIDIKDFPLTDCDKDSQYLFFKNKTVKVTKKGIEEFNPADVPVCVWSEELIDFDFKKTEKLFKVSQVDEYYKLELNRRGFSFMEYLLNTSRIYWQKEDIEGLKLTADEIYEENLHFINKCYAIGYLMHRYKDMSKPWAVFAMDARESLTGEANGGTGKSIAFKAIRKFMKSVTLNGRDKKLTDNPHIFQNVDKNTDYVLIDDASGQLDYRFFYAPITGEMEVNPKHNQSYELPFEEVPKFAFTSNDVPRNLDASLERRLLFCAFSDYYHKKDRKGYYKEERSPATEFGKNLITDYTPEEMNLFYNFMLNCLELYLNFDKIDPPMQSIEKRNLRAEMGEMFMDWATEYFSDDTQFNVSIEKNLLINNFIASTSYKGKPSSARFKKQLYAFCAYHGLTLNPDEMINDRANNRIYTRNNEGKSCEMFYIQTPINLK